MKQYLKNKKIILPLDVVVDSPAGPAVKTPDVVTKDETIMDAGPETIELIRQAAAEAKFILWNGPLGNFENGYAQGTLGVAKAVAASSAHAVVGGGDTIAAISHLGLEDKIGFVSTGGGAMLDFLASGTLPGIEAIKKSRVKVKK